MISGFLRRGGLLSLVDIWAALMEVCGYIYKAVFLWTPVSFPGHPIKNPLKRHGLWNNKVTRLITGWVFSSDAESHTISEKGWKVKQKMTGESAGRQIWYRKEGLEEFSEGRASAIDDDLTFNASVNPNSSDKVFRNIMLSQWKGPLPSNETPRTAKEAARKALAFYQMLQCEDGHWAGDYGGPMFLMPGLVCTLFLTKAPFPDYKKQAMITYLLNHQQADGGWGTHIECASTMFGTVLSYVALRLLGYSEKQESMVNGLKFIHKHGGVLYAPSWAKFWLACIGVYDWWGINPIPAEMWLLPRWLPFHPGKLWCHCRMVYLPMCYVYCTKFTPDVKSDPILLSLRKELYVEDYDSIDWIASRQLCAEIDVYSPLNPVMKIAQDVLVLYEILLEKFSFLRRLRRKALNFVIDYIHAEDIQTNFVNIGPVNKCLNMLSVWIASGFDNNNENFQRHLPRVDDYLWVAEDGMKMQGYNGSQCWDTSFAIQGIVEGGLAEEFPECAKKVYSYLKRTQIAKDEDNRDYYFRHQSKGGWPFSTAAHGWPISDCTAEGLKGALSLHSIHNFISDCDQISRRKLEDSCDVILSYHNKDGGWATYENNRGYGWYEMMNPSEVFGDIMIDYSYVECSSACITALKSFANYYPDYRANDVQHAIQAGRKFLKSLQREDGSWYGSWGVCFTYGTWFGIEGLIAAGEAKSSVHIKKACKFLLSKQNSNGGWGESYVACVNKAYPSDGCGPVYGHQGSGVVQTAWAVLGLIVGDSHDHSEGSNQLQLAIHRGIRFIMGKQLSSGDWEQEAITGVFNRSCGITYTAYRNVFPLWALARYSKEYEK